MPKLTISVLDQDNGHGHHVQIVSNTGSDKAIVIVKDLQTSKAFLTQKQIFRVPGRQKPQTPLILMSYELPTCSTTTILPYALRSQHDLKKSTMSRR